MRRGIETKLNRKPKISLHEFCHCIGVINNYQVLEKGVVNSNEDEEKRQYWQFNICTGGDDVIAQCRMKDLRFAFSYVFHKKSTSD